MSEKTVRISEQPKRHGGRVKSSYPEFTKKLRATTNERLQFLDLLQSRNPTGDSRQDFLILLDLLQKKG